VLPLSTWASKTINETQALGPGNTGPVITEAAVGLPGDHPNSVDASAGLLNNEYIVLTLPGPTSYRMGYTKNSPQLVLWDPDLVVSTNGFAIIMPLTTPSPTNLRFSQFYDNTDPQPPASQTFNIGFT
jgi:hypothetical protein